jgi:proteasome lid subunit RPN8/RPN11
MSEAQGRALTVSAASLAALQAHARESHPEECCGLIIERDGGEEVVRVTNIQNELHGKDPEQFPRTAATAYAMRYQEVEPLLEAAYRGEVVLRAVYHSHPEHDAYFSEHDRAAAEGWVGDPNYAAAGQIVMSVRGGEVVNAKAFGWDEGIRSYVEILLISG